MLTAIEVWVVLETSSQRPNIDSYSTDCSCPNVPVRIINSKACSHYTGSVSNAATRST